MGNASSREVGDAEDNVTLDGSGRDGGGGEKGGSEELHLEYWFSVGETGK